MKIIYKTGDLLQAPERVILHGCNNQGRMGSGIAKQIRDAHPDVYREYIRWCRPEYLGDFLAIEAGDRVIINAVTQDGYGYDGARYVRYDAVADVLEKINKWCSDRRYKAVAMPKIGAGLGGGNWRVIEAIIEATLTDVVPVVYELEG